MAFEGPLETIGVIIIIAIVFSIFVKKLRQNEVIGFIIAGFLLGPFWLKFLNPTDPLVVGFSELGLFVLLFYLGIELSIKDFLAAGSTIFSLAIIDMSLTVFLGVAAMMLLGHGLLFSIIIGIMLFSASTAIIGKFVIDRGLMQRSAAKISLSILILQDFLGVLLLVFITGASSSGKSVFGMAIAAVVFAVSAFYAVYQLSRVVEKWMKENGFGHTEITLYALGTGLIVATLAAVLGLSTAIGAYFAGFALSETDSGHKIKKDVNFLRDFFLVFFFVGFGTTIFYDAAANAFAMPSTGELAFLIGLAFSLGVLGIFAHSITLRIFGAKFGLNAEDSSLSAILLSPLGEFLIIIATVVLASGVLGFAEAKLLSPLAFMLIIITLFIFEPLYNKRELHQKIFSGIPAFPARHEKSTIKPRATYAVQQLKDFALNVFVVICFLWVAVLLYNELPRFGVPIIYSREATTALVFLFFASVPGYKALRALKRLFVHLRKEGLANKS